MGVVLGFLAVEGEADQGPGRTDRFVFCSVNGWKPEGWVWYQWTGFFVLWRAGSVHTMIAIAAQDMRNKTERAREREYSAGRESR